MTEITENTEAADSGQARTYVLQMPAGMALRNENDRGHWGTLSRKTKALRRTAYWQTKAAKIPAMQKASVVGVYEPPTPHPRRDPANWYPSFKAVVDGMIDAGMLPDDNSERLEGPDMRIGDVHPKGRLVLYVTDLSDTVAAPDDSNV
ncbi:hypothetical protein ACIHFD_49485 [Nonomuraea sp. NPDC051941]|uniref:hypothetical protein n=1 Tax=Nonomuraea sp. NPDC051941 TaxID=3364373 RepID=UPI0037C82C76